MLLDELVEGGGNLEASGGQQVGAVHDDPGAGVVGHAEEPAVVGAGLHEALEQVVTAEAVTGVREVDQAPAASNACAWVLPSSMTSGLSLLDRAVVSRSTMPSHC